MSSAKMPHAEHDQHLCYLHNMGYVDSNLAEYKNLVKDPKFVCRKCGRAAASEKNVCKAEKL